MAETDWTELSGGLSDTEIAAGVTAGIARPNGGGSFVYGFNSLGVVTGARGIFVNLASFAPMAKGGRITAAIQRGLSTGTTAFSPALFIGLQGSTVTDSGYLLGVSDADPAHIILKKGSITSGLAEATPPSGGVLAVGTVAKSAGTWYHLRMDMVVNDNGDVVLNVFENDLDTNAVTAPVWDPIPGMDDLTPTTGLAFIDDALGVNSGSVPHVSGRVGFAFSTSDTGRRGYFDHVTVERQL